MKNTIKIILLSFLVIFTSCNDFLDVEPDRRADLNSKEKIQKMLVSAYPNVSFAVLTELSSDNIDDLGTDVSWKPEHSDIFYWKSIDKTGTDMPQDIWAGLYNAIETSNVVLDAIAKSNDESDLQAQKGEALVTRAYSHFVLVNIFGQHYNTETSETDLGVFYNKGIETTLDPKYKRESVASNYKNIEKDLLEGLPLLSDKNIREGSIKYHFNLKSAYAFAARFYLYYGKWAKAEEYADKVLGADPSSILKNYNEICSGTYEKFMGVPREFVNPERPANLLIQEMLSARVAVLTLWSKTNANNRFRHYKYISTHETIEANSFFGNASKNFAMDYNELIYPLNIIYFNNVNYNSPDDRNIYTTELLFSTDETLLVRAEARALLGKYDLAVDDLNIFIKNFVKKPEKFTLQSIEEFYNKIPYYTNLKPTQKKRLHPKFNVEAGKQESLIHAILQSRRLLTLNDGLRWFDIKRYGIEIPRRLLKNYGTEIAEIVDELKVDDPRRAIQLPKNVIEAGLEANPR